MYTDGIQLMSDTPLQATTTGEQDRQSAGVRDASVLRTAGQRDELSLRTAGQRRVNVIWEITQATIAISVVCTFLYVSGHLVITQGSDMTAFVVLSNIVALVIGFYFGRTNHARQGGLGPFDGDTR